MLYPIMRRLLFCLPAETAHHITLSGLKALTYLPMHQKLFKEMVHAPKQVMGLNFTNALGLAAGFDKNGDYIDALSCLGFGFIEVGTVTAKPQAGNHKPRLFRLSNDDAIINRMGFNNKGVDYLLTKISKRHYPGILGVNIGKNKATPNGSAINDYVYCLRSVYPYADYVVVNISSPNTPNLRNLQHGDPFKSLLDALKEQQTILTQRYQKRVPLLVKLSPDVDNNALSELCKTIHAYQIEGVIATNTTIARDGLTENAIINEAGGLSGRPLRDKSTRMIARLRQELGDEFAIIGVGGVMCADDARAKIAAGADLVQVYSGLIYQGPSLVYQAAQALSQQVSEKESLLSSLGQ